MMRWTVRGAIAAALLGCLPATASADWFFAAGIGRAIPAASAQPAERTYELAVGSVSAHGWIGAEANYALVPKFENGTEARAITGNLLIGKKTGSGWRPYGAVGFGHLGPVNTFGDNFRLFGTTAPQRNVITFGGGVMGDFSKRFGARADVRTFRDLTGQTNGVPARFTFTRITAGVYIKF
jgi:hypothetical protein